MALCNALVLITQYNHTNKKQNDVRGHWSQETWIWPALCPLSLMCPWVGQGPPGPSGTNAMMKGSASVHQQREGSRSPAASTHLPRLVSQLLVVQSFTCPPEYWPEHDFLLTCLYFVRLTLYLSWLQPGVTNPIQFRVLAVEVRGTGLLLCQTLLPCFTASTEKNLLNWNLGWFLFVRKQEREGQYTYRLTFYL